MMNWLFPTRRKLEQAHRVIAALNARLAQAVINDVRIANGGTSIVFHCSRGDQKISFSVYNTGINVKNLRRELGFDN